MFGDIPDGRFNRNRINAAIRIWPARKKLMYSSRDCSSESASASPSVRSGVLTSSPRKPDTSLKVSSDPLLRLITRRSKKPGSSRLVQNALSMPGEKSRFSAVTFAIFSICLLNFILFSILFELLLAKKTADFPYFIFMLSPDWAASRLPCSSCTACASEYSANAEESGSNSAPLAFRSTLTPSSVRLI